MSWFNDKKPSKTEIAAKRRAVAEALAGKPFTPVDDEDQMRTITAMIVCDRSYVNENGQTIYVDGDREYASDQLDQMALDQQSRMIPKPSWVRAETGDITEAELEKRKPKKNSWFVWEETRSFPVGSTPEEHSPTLIERAKDVFRPKKKAIHTIEPVAEEKKDEAPDYSKWSPQQFEDQLELQEDLENMIYPKRKFRRW
jgi:hypothetical protein